jgi:hypothetical protein
MRQAFGTVVGGRCAPSGLVSVPLVCRLVENNLGKAIPGPQEKVKRTVSPGGRYENWSPGYRGSGHHD